MKARLLLRRKFRVASNAFVEMVVWELPRPSRGSAHLLKYRLALVAGGACILRYDNEAGKGDHKHVGEKQVSYEFRSLVDLRVDFMNEVRSWLRSRSES